MSEKSRLQADPLFKGLARPAMALGVTYLWFMLNGMFIAIFFINTSDFLNTFLLGISIHMVGFLVFSREPRFLDIIMIKGAKCMKCRNRAFHELTNSYDTY